MTEHDNLELSESMHYCKSNLKKGCDHKSSKCVCEPIIITSLDGSKNTREFVIDLWEKDINGVFTPVRLQCIFGNTSGKVKASGAKAMLEIRR